MQAAIEPAAVSKSAVRASPARTWWAARRRVVVVCLCLGACAYGALSLRRIYPRTTLDTWLSSRGLLAVGEPVAMPDEGGVAVLARAGAKDLSDVYWIEGSLGRDGSLEGPRGLYNLTRTAGAEELDLFRHGSELWFSVKVGERFSALERFDLAGEPDVPGGLGARLRRQVANWQQTGRIGGIARHRYRLTRSVPYVRTRVERDRIWVDAGLSGAASISLRDGSVRSGGDLLAERQAPVVVGAWLGWLVDRVRAVSWIGPEPIAWLEQRVFGVRDSLTRAYKRVDETDHAAEVAEAMPLSRGAREGRVQELAVPNPESGWPPAAVPPLLSPAVKGEGEWRAIVDDPFVRSWPSGPPLFYQAFLRGDEERPYNRIYLTLWDPRQLQLHIVSGVQEPVSATGETGTGTIPRDPQTLSRLVAAFNGGFQALHGEFGMMADGQVYLPPKPWAATVAVYRDGSVGMGSWPGPKKGRRVYDEEQAVAEIPADMLSMRQNLTSLVEDGEINPWRRWWWGAAPAQSDEQTLTQRSALCLRDDGFMLYAWGDFLSPEALAAVLKAARCARAMHLDMNAGHSGMEFYNVLGPDEHAERLGKTRVWQHEGPLRGRPGYRVRARRAVTAMQMPMPRYIRKDPRDFFYLTLKPTLPGPAGEGPPPLDFETQNLPHAGWPPALARHQSKELRVLRIDPRRIEAAQVEDEALVELVVAPPREGDSQVFMASGSLGPRVGVGQAPAGALMLGRGPLLDLQPGARAWLGVDRHGFLIYAESDARSLPDWGEVRRRLGVEQAVALSPRERLGLRAGTRLLAPDGRRALQRAADAERVLLAGQSGAASRVLFGDTEPRPYRYWAFLQDQRVRYFREAEPSARAPAGALAPGVNTEAGEADR